MRMLEHGSARYGPCEVCNTHVATMYIAKYQGDYVFGHKLCLEELNNKHSSRKVATEEGK